MIARSGDAKRPSHTLLYGLLGLMVLIWSGNYIVGKLALREFSPLALVCVRTTLAGLFMLPVYLVQATRTDTRKRDAPWTRSDIPMLLFLGVIGVALNQILFVFGLSLTSVAHAALVIALTPLLVLALAAARGLEHFTLRKAVGMLIAVSGVGALNFSRAAGASLAGDVLILGAALTFTFFTVFGKESSSKHGNITLNTFAYTGGALILSPVTFYMTRRFDLFSISWRAWAGVVYMALFSSVICYLIYYYALKYIAASRASALSYLQPLLATLMALPVLGEAITLPLAFGGLLILTGVYVTERT